MFSGTSNCFAVVARFERADRRAVQLLESNKKATTETFQALPSLRQGGKTSIVAFVN
jgi:hypothetical protein